MHIMYSSTNETQEINMNGYQAAYKFKETGFKNVREVIEFNSMNEFDTSCHKLVGSVTEVIYGKTTRFETRNSEGVKIGGAIGCDRQAVRKLAS